MYLEHYGLSEPPFAITPNPRFLFYSAKHREAYNHLLYGIRERKGFVQLTGDVGAGKTTLCRAMLDALGIERAHVMGMASGGGAGLDLASPPRTPATPAPPEGGATPDPPDR